MGNVNHVGACNVNWGAFHFYRVVQRGSDKKNGPYSTTYSVWSQECILGMREEKRNENWVQINYSLGMWTWVTWEYYCTDWEMMMAMCLDFEVQQVAVDLVINIGVVLLLAQVQSWDVHSGLQAQQVDKIIITHTHNSCLHPYFNTFSFVTVSSHGSLMIQLFCFSTKYCTWFVLNIHGMFLHGNKVAPFVQHVEQWW